MSKRPRTARRAQRRREHQKHGQQQTTGRRSRGLLISIAVGGGLFLVLTVMLFRAGTASPEATAASVALAEQNAGAPVEVVRGGVHTVLHSTAPLPSASRPSADPRPTLVWFSGTWCHFCERMSPFAHAAASQFTDRIRFVEKSVDHDREAASRYGIRGTPAFVLIDQQGREVTRFHFQPDTTRFAAQIEIAIEEALAHN